MKLSIQQTLGIVSAEIDLEPGRIVEVVGPNASGKTSIAVCAQAVLARDSNPLGLSAAESKRNYPHDGAEDASVELYHPATREYDTWRPARGTMQFNDAWGALSHPTAVGLIDFTGKMKAKERAEVFQSALLPDPETVLKAVHERLAEYLPADDLAGAMEMLAERGWDATEAVYSERGKESKRAWNAVTGKTWGIRVAADWRPDGWLADFDHLTPQIAEERVTNARDALNALHRVQAISESEQEAAERAAADLPILELALKKLNDVRAQVLADRDKIPALTAADRRQRLQAEIDDERRNLTSVQQCPHCDEALAIRKNKIVAGENPVVLQSRIDELQKHWDTADAELTALSETVRPLNAQLRLVEEDIREQQSLLNNCKAFATKTGEVQTEADRAALAQAEQAVEDTREVVKLVQAEADATRIHQTIIRYTEIARALGPEGVRSKMLADGMRKLNGGLAVVAKSSGWPRVEISDACAITSGVGFAGGSKTDASYFPGRPIVLCSESERWRAQAAIQLTLGAITGSKAVVLDRADLLDTSNRAGLVTAVNRVVGRTQMSVLLCSTGAARPDAPWKQISISDGKTLQT